MNVCSSASILEQRECLDSLVFCLHWVKLGKRFYNCYQGMKREAPKDRTFTFFLSCLFFGRFWKRKVCFG